MYEVINPQIIKERKLTDPILSIYKRSIIINQGAENLMNARIGLYLQLYRTLDRVYISISMEMDGFPIRIGGNTHLKSPAIHSTSLARTFRRLLGNPRGSVRLRVKGTTSELRGNPLFEVIMKPLKKDK